MDQQKQAMQIVTKEQLEIDFERLLSYFDSDHIAVPGSLTGSFANLKGLISAIDVGEALIAVKALPQPQPQQAPPPDAPPPENTEEASETETSEVESD